MLKRETAIVSVIYSSTGLRLGEVIRLKVNDIDTKRTNNSHYPTKNS